MISDVLERKATQRIGRGGLHGKDTA